MGRRQWLPCGTRGSVFQEGREMSAQMKVPYHSRQQPRKFYKFPLNFKLGIFGWYWCIWLVGVYSYSWLCGRLIYN